MEKEGKRRGKQKEEEGEKGERGDWIEREGKQESKVTLVNE